MSADDGDRLIVRPRPPHDGATPSGASLMIEVFARLHHVSLDRAGATPPNGRRAATPGANPRRRNRPCCWRRSICSSAAAKSWSKGARRPAAIALAREALAAADPTIVTLRLDPALWPKGAPGGRPRLPALPAAMLCRGQVCSLPVASVAELRTMLAER